MYTAPHASHLDSAGILAKIQVRDARKMAEGRADAFGWVTCNNIL